MNKYGLLFLPLNELLYFHNENIFAGIPSLKSWYAKQGTSSFNENMDISADLICINTLKSITTLNDFCNSSSKFGLTKLKIMDHVRQDTGYSSCEDEFLPVKLPSDVLLNISLTHMKVK